MRGTRNGDYYGASSTLPLPNEAYYGTPSVTPPPSGPYHGTPSVSPPQNGAYYGASTVTPPPNDAYYAAPSAPSHPNGGYYTPSPPPQPSKEDYRGVWPTSIKSSQSEGGKSRKCFCNPCAPCFKCCGCIMNCVCLCVLQILCVLVLILGLIILILWLIFRPNLVKYYASDAKLSVFDYNNNNFNYNFTVNFTIRNPNRRVGFYYDQIEATAFYQGQTLSSLQLPTFYQGHKTTSNLSAAFVGKSSVTLEKKALKNYNKNKNSGKFDIQVELHLQMRPKFTIIKLMKLKPKVKCDLTIPWRSFDGVSAGNFESTRCAYQ